MSETTMDDVELLSLVDHPKLRQEWWNQAARTERALRRDEILAGQFSECGEEFVPRLLGNVSTACAFVDSRRASYETDTLSRLDLDDSQMAEYDRIAGNPAHVVEAVGFFGSMALRYFDLSGLIESSDKIGLELGGARLHGVEWEIPQLDRLVEIISDGMNDIEGVEVRDYRKEDAEDNSYKLIPLEPIDDDGKYNPEFEFAIVRQRRPELDIFIPGSIPKIRVFREANGLIVIDNIDEKDRETIRLAFKEYKDWETNLRTDSVAAKAGGDVFQKGVQAGEREKSHFMVPISAQIVMATDGAEYVRALHKLRATIHTNG